MTEVLVERKSSLLDVVLVERRNSRCQFEDGRSCCMFSMIGKAV
jgi:hypothetical protein